MYGELAQDYGASTVQGLTSTLKAYSTLPTLLYESSAKRQRNPLLSHQKEYAWNYKDLFSHLSLSFLGQGQGNKFLTEDISQFQIKYFS